MAEGKAQPNTGRRINPNVKRKIYELSAGGFNNREVGEQLGISRDSVAAVLRRMPSNHAEQRELLEEEALPLPKQEGELSDPAQRALVDFDFFRRRYFGRLPTAWQADAAYRLEHLVYTPAKEYVVLNAPPGAGKTTLLVHDLVCWLLCRDRRLRVLVGARTQSQADKYTNRLRRSFARTTLAHPSSEDVVRGKAVEPSGILAKDFGRFRPLGNRDRWAMGEFTIAQLDDVNATEKESSVTAYGMDGGFLGGRYDVVVWDDLVDRKNTRTLESLEALIEVYDLEMETRVEPGGLLALCGQRMKSNDLYRYALDQVVHDSDWDEDGVEVDAESLPRKYRHIVYKAHYPELCRGRETHRWADDRPPLAYVPPATPEGEVLRGLFGFEAPRSGCLLDPLRLPWKDLANAKAGRTEKFHVVYQQEDVDPSDVLVPHIWVDGGTDPLTGEFHPGCWDKTRGVADPPRGLVPPVYSIATADPSPTKFWSLQHWLYHPASEQRFLIDLVRQVMDAPEFLDWDYNTGCFTGWMEEWQQRSIVLGIPITHWVVEANAAQRFILQYDHARRWSAKHGVSVVPHQTNLNKWNEEYGVKTIAPHYRFGRVRLPGKQGDGSRLASLKLVDEVTRWPDGATDDCVMAHWFLETNLPRLVPQMVEVPGQRRPSWLGARRGGLRAVSG